MKEFYKKLNQIKESNNSVFGEIFGFGKKEEPQQQSNGQVEKVGEDNYRMGNSIITGMKGAPEAVFLGYDFKNSPLSWVLDSVFKGEIKLNLSTTPHSLENFNGDWNSGTFKGKYFGPYSKFIGGQFGDESSNPLFLPEYANWKDNAHAFFNGTIKNTNEGLLGFRNLAFGKIENVFNILSIAPGMVVTITLRGGVTHSIFCSNRLSAKSRTFSYKITNGKTKKEYEVTHDWSEIRGNTPTEFLKNTNINLQTSNKVISIFDLDISEGIESAAVSTASTSGGVGSSFNKEEELEAEKTEQELAITQQHYDLSRAPILGINKLGGEYWNENGVLVKNNVGRIYFHAPNGEYFKQFENVVKNLDNKIIASDLSKLRASLANKVITGAPSGYPWLANIIGVDTSKNKVEDKGFIETLNRIESFLKYFVAIIVKYAGQSKRKKGDADTPNTKIQELIKSNLKNYIGVTPKEAPIQQAAPAPLQPVKPKKSPKRRLGESVIDAVRNVISENLKHF